MKMKSHCFPVPRRWRSGGHVTLIGVRSDPVRPPNHSPRQDSNPRLRRTLSHACVLLSRHLHHGGRIRQGRTPEGRNR